jgi:hypothetical protein
VGKAKKRAAAQNRRFRGNVISRFEAKKRLTTQFLQRANDYSVVMITKTKIAYTAV